MDSPAFPKSDTSSPESLAQPALLAQLAVFANRIHIADVPNVVRREACLNVLDTIGCIASGARLLDSQRLLQAEIARGGPEEATVLGLPKRLPVEVATRVNGYMGDAFELNDLIGGHASIATVTPSIALAESIRASGAELVEAVITGIEVVCRVHGGFYAYQKPFTESAMVQVTVASAVGAAAAACKLLKLDVTHTLNAMAIAGALTSWGPAELVFGDGNSLKPILFGGWPGSIGLIAANYARHGLSASARLLESPIGYYATVATRHDRAVVLDFENWRLAQPRRKLHACCGYMHSAIDAVVRLRARGHLRQAARLRVHMPDYIIPAISGRGLEPTTPNEAQFNIEYCLAHALIDSDVILPEHSMNCVMHLKRPEIAEALSKFDVVADPAYSHYRYCRVEVINSEGRTVDELTNDAPRGSEWNPMSDEELKCKFLRLTADFLDRPAGERYVAQIDRLEFQTNTEWLLRSFI